MNVEAIILLQRKRQFRQKTPLYRTEPAARPLDRGLGFGIHGFRHGAHGVVMVAAYGHGSAIDKAHDNINRPFRIGAISDVIAEANYPFRAPRPRKVEARAERLPVGMDIRKHSQQHDFLRGYDTACSGAGLDGYQTTPRQWAAIAPKAGNGMPPWHSNKPHGVRRQ